MLIDDYTEATIANLYAHRSYIRPSFGHWHDWFAWYPIRMVTWVWVPYYERYLKMTKWVWLKTIKRRFVLHGPPVTLSVSREYTTFFDILRFG